MKETRILLTVTILLAGAFSVVGCGPAEEAPETMEEAAAPAETAAETEGFLDPNNTDREALLAVPGVDEMLADALAAGRPYADMTQVDAVVGDRLSDEQKDALYARVWMPLDLNSASEAEILPDPRGGREHGGRVRGVPPLRHDRALPLGNRQVRGRGGSGAA